MFWPLDLTSYLASGALQILITTTCIVATPKGSLFRYAAIPCIVWLAYHLIQPYDGASPTLCSALTHLILMAVQAVNLLLLNPLDDTDLAREDPKHSLFLSDRIYHAAELLSQFRAIGTSRQIKSVPAQPAYYGRQGKISRGRFLLRQSVFFLWQYLVLDLMQALARQKAFQEGDSPGFSHIDWFVPVDQWVERGLTNLTVWFALSRIVIDAHYRLSSVVFVGSGLDVAANWPPLFGSMADVYTIRKFWGKFWHQYLRQPFTAVSNFIARDVLHLPRPSILERYTNIFLVFLLSGMLHVIVDHIQTVPYEYSGSLIGFPIMALGIMLEDGVQALWKTLSSSAGKEPSSDEESVPPLWQRAVGYIWTMTWLAVTSTWYLHPILQLPGDLATLVPLSLCEKIGVQPLGSIIVGTGLLVGFIFGAEI
ncbi:uncharacterized protein N7482_008930 [Penicillium canariense]|uniref:Wax synthase domain-containing protein n=1 Tax=Penicillium canariense TaxID=189055 RepID=A0A9W9HX72_9EURO|nr:uncharacterized protein N7482_008930 [Penicillium canariense]KAJ5157830.1 hypothetical protein N7482_008930 [Penicillium canariense]